MENHSIDPFEIFGLPYEFDIAEIDAIYYEFHRKNENLEIINVAYKILKDPVKKLFVLCKKHHNLEVSTTVLASVISLLKQVNEEELRVLMELNLKEAIDLAKLKQWSDCWIKLQEYQYLKKYQRSVIKCDL